MFLTGDCAGLVASVRSLAAPGCKPPKAGLVQELMYRMTPQTYLMPPKEFRLPSVQLQADCFEQRAAVWPNASSGDILQTVRI